ASCATTWPAGCWLRPIRLVGSIVGTIGIIRETLMMSMMGGGWSFRLGVRPAVLRHRRRLRPATTRTNKKRDRDFRNGSAWRTISVLFLALGINKQLDLQTALTEAGRVLARYQGWYEQRQFVQLVVIALFAMTCLIALCCFG